MKFKIKNVGKISHAEIETDGITVIAGYNNTGKTTILRSVDVMLKTYLNLKKNIYSERSKSIRSLIMRQEVMFDKHGFEELSLQFLYDIADEICEAVEKNGFQLISWEKFYEIYMSYLEKYASEIDEQQGEGIEEEIPKKIYSKLKKIEYREDKEYQTYLAGLNLRNEFFQQAGSFVTEDMSEIQLEHEKFSCEMRFQNNKLQKEKGSDLGDALVIYIETRHILDNINMKGSRIQEQELRRMLTKERNFNKDEISYEQYQETEKNLDVLEEIFHDVIHGKLLVESGEMRYKDDSVEDAVSIRNVASGMKIFLVLQRLVENGSLKENSWILIDEPESNLHPEWHLKFAEILILLNLRMNIRILLTSHSPYFMRALEVKLADYEIKDRGRFYLTEEKDRGMYETKNVTKSTEEIYKQLYKPLELL